MLVNVPRRLQPLNAHILDMYFIVCLREWFSSTMQTVPEKPSNDNLRLKFNLGLVYKEIFSKKILNTERFLCIVNNRIVKEVDKSEKNLFYC